MTRMTGPDCTVMCNLINTHTHYLSLSLSLFWFSAGTSSSLQTGGGACEYPTGQFAKPGCVHAHGIDGVTGCEEREGPNAVWVAIEVGGGNEDGIGGGNGDVNGYGEGGGAGAGTRVEANERTQDGDGDGAET